MPIATMALWPPDMQERWKQVASHIQSTARLNGGGLTASRHGELTWCLVLDRPSVDTCAVKGEKFLPPRESLASREGLLY